MLARLSLPVWQWQAIWTATATQVTLLMSIVICVLHFGLRMGKVRITLILCKPLSFVTNYIRAWVYLFDGPNMIHHSFRKSNGEPFELLAPDARMVFVSSAKDLKEVDSTPDTVLSLNGAAKHLLQPVYTMNGFNWFDRRGVEGVGFVRTLRTLLTNSLPQLLPDLSFLVKTRWPELLANQPVSDGAIRAAIYPMMMDLVVLINARSLFGEELAKNRDFLHSARTFVEETLLNAEIVKLLPEFLRPVVGGILSRLLNSHRAFCKILIPATETRIEEDKQKRLGHSVPKRADCIQWTIETAPKGSKWSAERVVNEMMAFWFGSVHILSTTTVYVLQDLCLHPEYVEAIRRELGTSYEDFKATGQGLPLLDSFIKESARLTPVESMSVRRSALQQHTLSNGVHLSKGDWVCAPLAAINKSADHYNSPDEFSGFRFVDPETLATYEKTKSSPPPGPHQPTASKLTDVSNSFLMWGTGRMACPGRYYASAFMKIVIAEIIMKYDIALQEPDAPRWISWRVARIPRPWTKMIFRSRSQSA